MSEFNEAQYRNPAASMDMSVDQGLRSFMLGVYNKMALGLLWSAVLAYVTSVPPIANMLYVIDPNSGALAGYTGLGWVVAFAPLVVILGSSFMMKNPSKTGANLLYWGIVTLIGAGLGAWVLLYTSSSLALTFLVTASAFGALSLFGYTTKKDMTGFGSFLIMAVWGLIAGFLVNMFLKSGPMDLILSGAGVLIFSGLIAFETQKLKYTYYAIGGDETQLSVATSYGALNLYISFINLFQMLLRFLGDRR
ncbi:Bax inhibitor-1/YccA family protein [Pseudaquidulcibacter saccharophilus]|uniref:Bax inhibitor-1/YccA family protein n=1 Tax=Pseudaquidulcibacter saccharophilus TaxID=2831900 RepID=UPI001EFF4C2B|nr:Bax inhibitor-1/YccA family protein [Pseudaquidulcibacter saccharophilus]